MSTNFLSIFSADLFSAILNVPARLSREKLIVFSLFVHKLSVSSLFHKLTVFKHDYL